MKQNNSFKFLETFLNCDGISGFENDIANVFMKYAKKYDAKIERDGFGSVIAKMGTSGPKLMIASHMDEVGFVVQRIDKTGMLKISPIGGHWVHTILAMKVKVINHKKEEFIGVIGSTSVHILEPSKRTKVMQMDDVYVDLGFSSDKEVKQNGIEVGDPVVRISKAALLADGDKYMAKAIDNRVGVSVLAKIIEKIKTENIKHNNQIFAVATAQEEVGLRGGKTSTQHIQPDIAIAIDTTASHDTPGVTPGDTKLGFGVAISMKDGASLANPFFANMLVDLAKKKKIPFYKYVAQGNSATDAGVLQYAKNGIPVVVISIPTRYLHTPFEISSIKDFQAVVDLILEFIKIFDQKEYQKLLY